MIPKIIHYTWFSGEPIPEHLQRFMATWKEHMPDWEIRLWDGDAARALNVPFVNEALDRRKWAFASDYVRFYAVYTGGGVYLDTDIEVFQSFEPFLKHRFFCARDTWTNNAPYYNLTSHIMGAEAGHPLLRKCMKYYERRHFDFFLDEDNPKSIEFTVLTSPVVLAEIASAFYGYSKLSFLDKYQKCDQDIHVYPSYYFNSPMFHDDPKTLYSIHISQGAWQKEGGSNEQHSCFDLRNQKMPLLTRIHKFIDWFTVKFLGIGVKFFKVHPSERK